MIYDAFTFFNELDLLELRLRTLDRVVDRFVVVEAPVTHSDQPKPLWFTDSRQRFVPWLDRIIHVVVNDMPRGGTNRWVRENFQRQAIMRGLKSAGSLDHVLIGDVDELPDPTAVRDRRVGGYQQVYMCYYLNAECATAPWVGTVMTSIGRLRHAGPQAIRDERSITQRIAPGGWHFAFVLPPELIHTKVRAFAHSEWDTQETHGALEERRAGLRDPFGAHAAPLVIRDVAAPGAYFPEELTANRDRYAHMLYKA